MRISDWSSDVCSSDLYRDDLDAFFGEFVCRSGKGGKLVVAERTPGTAVEQDHPEPTGQVARQMDFAATGAGKGKRGKDIAIFQHHNCAPCLSCLGLNCLALKAPNDPSPLPPAPASGRGADHQPQPGSRG